MGLDIKELLEPIVVSEASDLHLKAGSPPGLRLHGKLQPMEGFDKLSPDEVRTLVNQLLSDEDREAYDREKELDFSMGIPGMARFRVNIFRQRGTCAAVMRKIPVAIPKIEDLGFPDLIRDLCRKPRGLVLITGPTGSGSRPRWRR